ncbi:hypothetical protein BJ138DRAFT_1156494 [Hygrophoropsis aurantiaca]|uniref:Uncharacterized protein n=1 Tax=Hygrophoropsis aurantiaca TaxID=72124 RepID=A0ACB8A784_9AGAM|nr:hypothetical protein BJ138DRAFT_1156494 [Hygrophoropsis aurantiaca]
MTFKVTFATPPVASKGFLPLLAAAFAKAPTFAQMAPVSTVTPAAMQSLEKSIPSGIPFDIQFIAFSCQSTSARLTRPLTIHANSTVMQVVLRGR